ncbi:MAG TPA: molybdopterin biosynthesis protein [Chloroflexaceae bacterium]|nr:molybdopterin biosynthesis protein [Chloroflexaceae bacterium]
MRRKYYLEDRSLEDARARFAAALERAGGLALPPPERVPLAEARGRVTAAPVYAAISAPHYHAAAMDGIAVRAALTEGATEAAPRRLALGPEAVWVDTGDPMPAGADAVIMAEHVQPINEATVEIAAAVAPWQHVRPLGEDIVATELVLPEGHALRPADLGALAAAGHAAVEVRRRPRVAIIPTGTELVPVEAAQGVRAGEIVEFNSLILAGLVEEWGGAAARLPPVPDRRELLRAAVEAALAEHEVVVVNAGSSAGSEDYTAAVLAELGEVVVHGVAIRPGHPVILAVAAGKPTLGLPGYPVSAALTAELFLRPLVYRLQGLAAPARPQVTAVMSRKLLSPLGEDEFVRVALGRVDGRLVATPLTRGAGVVMSLVRADGLAHIPRFSEGLHAGEEVRVELVRDPSEVEGTLVAIGSHDLALDLLGGHMRRHAPHTRLSSANVGSLGGLMALRRGDAHLAGTHLLDEATGAYNRPFVERLLPGEEIVLVHLAYRDQGFILPPGNPRGLGELRDLLAPGVRLANRQKGSGTRVLLDYHLKLQGLDPAAIAGYEREEFTHMAVAAAIMSGAADVGLGILAAARALGLAFVPLFQERYDLAVPRRHWESERLAPLRQTLADPDYRAAVAALGGYDVSRMGEEL